MGLGCHSSTGSAFFWPLLILFSFMKDHGCFCNLQGSMGVGSMAEAYVHTKDGAVFGGTRHSIAMKD